MNHNKLKKLCKILEIMNILYYNKYTKKDVVIDIEK